MGRPLRKDVNGVDVRASYANVNAGIRCEFHDGSTVQSDGVIVRQRGAKTYVVTRIGNLNANLESSTSKFTCVLVSGTPAAGQMRIRGSLDGTYPGSVAIRKLTKRLAVDFSGNRYKWYLENDSSEDVIRLTAI